MIPYLDGGLLEVCESCQICKQHGVKFSNSLARSAGPLELVHIDLLGPIPILARNGERYFMTLIDDFLKKVGVFLEEETRSLRDVQSLETRV